MKLILCWVQTLETLHKRCGVPYELSLEESVFGPTSFAQCDLSKHVEGVKQRPKIMLKIATALLCM